MGWSRRVTPFEGVLVMLLIGVLGMAVSSMGRQRRTAAKVTDHELAAKRACQRARLRSTAALYRLRSPTLEAETVTPHEWDVGVAQALELGEWMAFCDDARGRHWHAELLRAARPPADLTVFRRVLVTFGTEEPTP